MKAACQYEGVLIPQDRIFVVVELPNSIRKRFSMLVQYGHMSLRCLVRRERISGASP